MTSPASRQRRLGIVAHGDRLNVVAFGHTQDINAGRLLVHGVLARALSDESRTGSAPELDAALHRALSADRN